MEQKLDEKAQTLINMMGDWKHVDDENSFLVSISRDLLRVDLNGVQMEFDGNCHWMDDYLVFIEPRSYYVKYADDKKLIFGKSKDPMVVNIPEWEYAFLKQ